MEVHMQYKDELNQIKTELDQIRKQGGRILFPDTLRSRLVYLWRSGCPYSEILKTCSVYMSQLKFWESKLKKSTKPTTGPKDFADTNVKANVGVKSLGVVKKPVDSGEVFCRSLNVVDNDKKTIHQKTKPSKIVIKIFL
jgi:hypothetical protein